MLTKEQQARLQEKLAWVERVYGGEPGIEAQLDYIEARLDAVVQVLLQPIKE